MSVRQTAVRAAITRIPVKVWDLPTRLFHWSLVGAVSVALATGFLAPEWFMEIHTWAGYFVAGILIFRLIWGFCGPMHSRFSALIRSTAGVSEHLKGLLLLKPNHHAGHNPSGSAMILLLIGTLSGLVISGLLVLGGEEKQGPLAGLTDYTTGQAAASWHGWLAIALCAMILVHIAGVVAESFFLRAPLIQAMITGWLPLPATANVQHLRGTRPLVAASLFAGAAGLIGGGLIWAERMPPYGIPAMPVNATYQFECGDCHWPFHPSLLPRASWARVMVGLGDHFGEDASLPEKVATEIAAYLDAYAAEAWDTEAGHALRIVSDGDPLRITASPFWRAKHRGIAEATFAAAPVKSPSNCIACHSDAATGLFADQAIRATPQTIKGIDQ